MEVGTKRITTVSKTEKVDLRVCDFIINRLTVDDFVDRKPSTDDLGMLKALVKKWKTANGTVTYKLGQYGDAGRFSAVGGVGLQCFRREIRALLAAPYYWDVDMKNAQPVFLEQLCKHKGWSSPYLSQYVARREEILAEAAGVLQCDRDTAKEKLAGMIFGCSRDSVVICNLPTYYLSLWDELNAIRDLIYQDKDYAELRKSVDRTAKRQNKNPRSSLSSLVLQTIERECLLAMEEALLSKKRVLATYIHDGGLVEKLPNEEEFPEDLLRFCEAEVETATTYKITLAVKPLQSPITVRNFGDSEQCYAEVKRMFEEKEGVSKIIEKALFSQKTADGIQLVTQEAIKVSYCDWKYEFVQVKTKKDKEGNVQTVDEETVSAPFLSVWLQDETKQTWRNIGFWPSHNPREGILNTFDGCAYERLLHNDIEEASEEDMQLLCELSNNVTGGHVDKFYDLMASILQHPEKRTGVCVVIKGESGVGKDTMLAFNGKLFGKKMYANIKDAGRDVFGQFNGLMKEAVFVHLEEANSAVFMDPKLAEMFKSLITSGNLPINQKHREQVDSYTYANFFLSTNRDLAVKIEHDDRRFWMLQARSEHKGDVPYWELVYKTLSKPSVQKSYAKMLLSRDITNFNATACRPETMLLDITRRKNIDLPIRYLNEVAFEQVWTCASYENGILTMPAKELHTRFCDWAQAQGLQHTMTYATFTDKLKLSGVLGDDAPLSHVRLRFNHTGQHAVSSYAIDISKLKTWLRGKKFVVDSANDQDPENPLDADFV